MAATPSSALEAAHVFLELDVQWHEHMVEQGVWRSVGAGARATGPPRAFAEREFPVGFDDERQALRYLDDNALSRRLRHVRSVASGVRVDQSLPPTLGELVPKHAFAGRRESRPVVSLTSVSPTRESARALTHSALLASVTADDLAGYVPTMRRTEAVAARREVEAYRAYASDAVNAFPVAFQPWIGDLDIWADEPLVHERQGSSWL